MGIDIIVMGLECVPEIEDRFVEFFASEIHRASEGWSVGRREDQFQPIVQNQWINHHSIELF